MTNEREIPYWVLRCDYPMDDNGGFLDIDDSMVDVESTGSWSIGKRFATAVPVPVAVDAIPMEEYTGPPKEMHDGQVLLMSDRLVKAIREAGVDNIDTYTAQLRNTETGEIYPYQAVNIVGLIAAADLAQSRFESYDQKPQFDVTFDSLVVNPDAAGGTLLFRLAENTFAIIVHSSVRDHIVNSGIDTVMFVQPEEWAHF